MSEDLDALRRGLTAAHTDALRVHDSPVRADRLFADLERVAASVPAIVSLGEEKSVRIAAALKDALRVLRREEDGREAAKHLQSALRLLEGGPRNPSPFLDD